MAANLRICPTKHAKERELNKVPEKLEDPGKFLIPCALQELDRTNALADSGASINLLPHSIYKQLGLGALKPTRMTLELANRSVTHPMGIAEDVVGDLLSHRKSFIDLYGGKLTLRSRKNDELVLSIARKNLRKSRNKQFAHAIFVIDFSKDEPFSGSTTNHSDALPPSSSPVKTSDNLEEFADELTLLKKNVDNENSNISDFDEPVLLNTLTPGIRKCSCYPIMKSLSSIFIPLRINDPVQEEIDIFLVLDDLIPAGVKNDDSEDEDNEDEDTVFDPRNLYFSVCLKPVPFASLWKECIQFLNVCEEASFVILRSLCLLFVLVIICKDRHKFYDGI
ncbi:reverse transcriptase domain-containing protein [Tanacetum coccineum]